MYKVIILIPKLNREAGRWEQHEYRSFIATADEAAQIIDKAHTAFREQGQRQGRDYDIIMTGA